LGRAESLAAARISWAIEAQLRAGIPIWRGCA
jgi:hypothetical protein